MKGLKIIPMFLLLTVLTYVGMLFVEANREEVSVTFGHYQSPPSAIGFVVLTSILIGMLIAGVLCSIELLALYVQNKNLKRRLSKLAAKATPPTEPPTDIVTPSTSGRFT